MIIYYTRESVDDLKRLRAFIEKYNPRAAQRIAGELLEAIGRLEDFPMIGLPVNHAPDPSCIRDLFIRAYTVRYLIKAESIYILRIWHDKENQKNL